MEKVRITIWFDLDVVEGFKALLKAIFAGDLDAWRTATERVGLLREGAPYTTPELWEHMQWFWAPILKDEVTFTPELAGEMVRRNTMTTGPGGQLNRHLNIPAGMVFLSRINFGLAGVLAGLEARGPWRGIIGEYILGGPPTTDLGRLSAETSIGPGV